MNFKDRNKAPSSFQVRNKTPSQFQDKNKVSSNFQDRNKATSWEPVESWYQGIVGEKGHYYHQQVILPNLLKMMNLEKISGPSVLDLACGQGVLGRAIPQNIPYVGFDIAPSFIKKAKQEDRNPRHHYHVADIAKMIEAPSADFSHAVILLAIQNIENPLTAFKNAFSHLRSQGKFYIVMNHPCFRIPRQSSWQVDEKSKTQFRRIDSYMSDMSIPIQTHPGKGEVSPHTLSFHHSLSFYSSALKESGFCISQIQEWCSDKVSTGKNAKMENRSRDEIPLFMTIEAIKM